MKRKQSKNRKRELKRIKYWEIGLKRKIRQENEKGYINVYLNKNLV